MDARLPRGAKEDDSCLVYVGGYLDESIVAERKLPTRNPAGSNRMSRIGSAFFAAGKETIILSPAISMRAGFNWKFIYPQRRRVDEEIEVIFSKALSIPLLGAMSSFLFLPFLLFRIARIRKVDAVIIYNFSPLLLLVAALAKYALKVPVLHNVEDVSEPRIGDFKRTTEARPLQQFIFHFCMVWISRLSTGAICPTSRFVPFLKKNIPVEIVTGCINVPPDEPLARTISVQKHVRILFAGKIEKEHGIDIFVEALQILARHDLLTNGVRVDICGGGTQSAWVTTRLNELAGFCVYYHGFVSDTTYQELLDRANVCVALQRPDGRYGSFKTPSKVYEYLGNGKAVIATDVGDLAQLPEHVIHVCKTTNSQEVAKELESCIRSPDMVGERGRAAAEYSLQHFALDKVGAQMLGLLD